MKCRGSKIRGQFSEVSWAFCDSVGGGGVRICPPPGSETAFQSVRGVRLVCVRERERERESSGTGILFEEPKPTGSRPRDLKLGSVGDGNTRNHTPPNTQIIQEGNRTHVSKATHVGQVSGCCALAIKVHVKTRMTTGRGAGV